MRRMSAYNRTVRSLTDQYCASGYQVITAPKESDLPDFLRNLSTSLSPDLLAMRRDDNIAVTVKSRNQSGQGEYWAALRSALRDRPGWRLEVILSSSASLPGVAAWDEERIVQTFLEARRLVGKYADAAILLAWSGVEATLRYIAPRFELDPDVFRPSSSLIGGIYSEGGMDRKDYDFLMQALEWRDSIAHGYTPEGGIPEVNEIRRIIKVGEQLLKEPGFVASAHSRVS